MVCDLATLVGDHERLGMVFLFFVAFVPARSAVGRLTCAKPFGRGVFIWIQRLLRRTQVFGHVLQVHADARPGAVAAAFPVDEDVGRLEMRHGIGMPRLPALQSGERVGLVAGAADVDQRVFRHAAA